MKPLAFTQNRSRGFYLVLGAWLLAFVGALPVTLMTGIKEVGGLPQCWIHLGQLGWKIYMVYLTCSLLVLPALIIAICYTHIVYTIWSKGQLVVRSQQQQQQRRPGNSSQTKPTGANKSNLPELLGYRKRGTSLNREPMRDLCQSKADETKKDWQQHGAQAVESPALDISVCGQPSSGSIYQVDTPPGEQVAVKLTSNKVAIQPLKEEIVYDYASTDYEDDEDDNDDSGDEDFSSSDLVNNVLANQKSHLIDQQLIVNQRNEDKHLMVTMTNEPNEHQPQATHLNNHEEKAENQVVPPVSTAEKQADLANKLHELSSIEIKKLKRRRRQMQRQKQQQQSVDRGNCVAQQHGSGVIPKARIKTIKMTLVIVAAFVLCWSPFYIINMCSVFGWMKNDTNFATALRTLSQSLAHLNSAVNPIIFWLFSSKRNSPRRQTSKEDEEAEEKRKPRSFMDSIKHLLCCVFCCSWCCWCCNLYTGGKGGKLVTYSQMFDFTGTSAGTGSQRKHVLTNNVEQASANHKSNNGSSATAHRDISNKQRQRFDARKLSHQTSVTLTSAC